MFIVKLTIHPVFISVNNFLSKNIKFLLFLLNITWNAHKMQKKKISKPLKFKKTLWYAPSPNAIL